MRTRIIAVAGGIAVLLLLVAVRIVQLTFTDSPGLAKIARRQQRELEIEIATRTSPRRLEEVARRRLGMGPPAPGQVVSEQ